MKQSPQHDLLERDGVLGRMAAQPARLVCNPRETGLRRMDSRPGDQDLAPLRTLLAKALQEDGDTVELGKRWHMAAIETGGRLEAGLWYGNLPGSGPCIRLAVTRASGVKLPEMRSSAPGLAALKEPERSVALAESVSLARRIAWAWLLPVDRV